jgi:DNA-directed RNA polymerase
MEQWFNTEMVNKGVEPDHRTLVTMIQGALCLLKDEKRKDTVQAYLDIAKTLGPEVYEAVNTSPDFTEEEWDTLVRLQGDDFEEMPAMVADLDVPVSTPLGMEIATETGLVQDESTAIREIPQKGRGMHTLKQALSVFDPSTSLQYPHDMEGSPEEKAQAYAVMRQIQIEESAVDATVERWKHENDQLAKMGIHGALKTKSMGALMWEWYTALIPLVQAELDAVKKTLSNSKTFKNSDRLVYGSYLELFDAKTLSAVTINGVVEATAELQYGANVKNKLSNITLLLANSLELEYTVQIARSRKASSEGVQRSIARRKLLGRLTKGRFKFDASKLSKLASELSQSSDLKSDGTLFPLHIKAKIGALLTEKLLQAATITVTRKDPRTGETISSVQPAYTHSSIYVRGKSSGILRMHNELMEKLAREPFRGHASFRLPMVVQPKPWESFKKGGYYRYPTAVVRTKNGDESQVQYATSAIRKGDMDKVLAGLDVLGRTPWQINKDVFRVMSEAWNAGEGIGELVPGNIDIPLPAEPSSEAPMAERLHWYKAVKAINEKKGGLHSKRCFQNLQLEMARSYLNETFYYPHNIDFRGRAYPIPPTLNHIGADIARGLLKFGKGRELGSVGLKWLKIHLANLYGFDKANLSEREEFTMENMNNVYDSATNPLSGSRWWLKAEDPWQCLACCFELKNALDSPDPSRYVSSFPVHQDGTCNGLQHYAALGGDADGAGQVNLVPSDRPQDIYTGVAELVKASISKSAKEGDPCALFLDGKITRKVVKRTVMTNVYGVTREGARLQVLEELKNAFPDFAPTDAVRSLNLPASYVAKRIFEALSQIFNGAQSLQFWLAECAARISTSVTAEQIQKLRQSLESPEIVEIFQDPKYKAKASPKTKTKLSKATAKKLRDAAMSFKSSVIWTTPLRMPVVQPYRATKPAPIKTCMQAITLVEPRASDAVSKRKQQQAFPPNFIHSLDATHMLLSALKCDEAGLTFAAVHDSFWTHPADIPKLNEILRDAFVRMHSEDIIGRLAAEFKARYAGSMYLVDLKTKSPAAQQITAMRASIQSQSKLKKNTLRATYEELLLEAERQRLLQSEDAEERKKGQEMVTCASIYESAQDSSAMVMDIQQPLFGEMNATEAKDIHKDMIDAELSGKEGHAFEAGADKAAVVDDEVAEPKAEKKAPKYQSVTQIWLPLTFPPVPKKGDFDVRRLKESKYFFS